MVKRPVLSRPEQRDEWLSKVLRPLDKVGQAVDTARDIVNALTSDEALLLTGIDQSTPLLKYRTVALFHVPTRADVLPLLSGLGAMPLMSVKYVRENVSRAGGTTNTGYSTHREFWPASYENPRVTVKEAYPIAPFLYSVVQGPNYGPLHTVRWVSRRRAKSGKLFAVECTIGTDPVKFERQRKGIKGAGVPNAFRYIWEQDPTLWPHGWTTGSWNRWTENATEGAFCTVFWPLSKFVNNVTDDVSEVFRRLLLGREGQRNEQA